MSTASNASMFSTPEMDSIFTISRQLQLMTRFEWALAAALEAHGIAETGAAAALVPFLNAEFVDLESLIADARKSGNLAIPFVHQLTSAVRSRSEPAARHIHFGATSQDVFDSALVLQLCEAGALVRYGLKALDAALERLAREQRNTIMAGRTWLQTGPPITLGLKVAGWLSAVRRHQKRFAEAEERALTLQFGGAVGTLAVLGEKGLAVSHTLAQTLELKEPDLPWHAHRDNLAELAADLGLLVGTLGKMARDVSLLMQTEVGEAAEPAGEGRGGSSTMPHKHNPVASAQILAAAARVPALVSTILGAMSQEHERGLGNWQAEWETIPDIYRLSAGALARAVEIADRLDVDRERMLVNLESNYGLAMSEAVSAALTGRVGRTQAHEWLQHASRQALAEKKQLLDVLLEMPEVREHFGETELKRLLDPENYLGSARQFIDRVLGADDEIR